MHGFIARHDRARLQAFVAVLLIADQPPRLAQEHDASRHIPWRETNFNIAIEAPRRDISQVQRSRPLGAEIANQRHEIIGRNRAVETAIFGVLPRAYDRRGHRRLGRVRRKTFHR
jgi:hypothetical protein